MNKQKNIITGTIEDCDTDEDSHHEHYLMISNASMATIIKVQYVENRTHPSALMQINIDCLALDCAGQVFELWMNFVTQFSEDRDQMLKDFSEGALWAVKGEFGIENNDGQMTIELMMPEYNRLSHEVASKAEAAFLINRKANHDC